MLTTQHNASALATLPKTPFPLLDADLNSFLAPEVATSDHSARTMAPLSHAAAHESTLMAALAVPRDNPILPVSPEGHPNHPEPTLHPLPEASQSALPTATTIAPAGPAIPALPSVVAGKVEKGQTAFTIFSRTNVEAAQVIELQQAIRSVYNLHQLRVGQPYRIELAPDGALQRFTYEIDADNRLQVVRDARTFVAQIEPVHYEQRERVVSGHIDDSLYAALMANHESPRLANDFANIFAWSVDFDTDLRQGDTFRLLIEERWRHGQTPQYHRILAAELVNQGNVLQAVYYVHNEQGAYYQPDGRSLRGMFLRSPLQYTRISSRFSLRRFHPILKRYRPHLGVDFAAPPGTPVRSVATGTVQWAGRKGANGKMVKIHHHNAYTSCYLHLSRFARGVRHGTRVEQGQIIGYVGSTGLSTGPHLDFRLIHHGTYINPLTHKRVEAPPLPQKVLSAFRTYAEDTLSKLSLSTSVPQWSAAHAVGE